jgi:hypothetical protein
MTFQVQRLAQAAVVCLVAIMFLPLVLAGAMVTLFASVSVHYLMSGYNNFSVDTAAAATPSTPRIRLRMPTWNSGHFRSWGSDSDSDGESEGRVSRWTRRSTIWLRNRAQSIALETGDEDERVEGEHGPWPVGRRSFRKALAARMKRIRGTLQNLSPSSSVAGLFCGPGQQPGEQAFWAVVSPRMGLKEKARLAVADDAFMEELLGELQGVDPSSEPVQAAIRSVRDILDM